MRIPVRVTPRAGRDAIEGVVDGRLRVRVAASPVDGAANAAVERLIAEELGMPPSSVRTIRGAAARLKVVAVTGLTRETIAGRWPDLVV
ncbi:MAG: DUF167 domain-containing protein [Chloroflexota bacterium]